MKIYYTCSECVAPKRHPGCHATCPEYQKDKELYRSLKDQKRSLDIKEDVMKGYYLNRRRY